MDSRIKWQPKRDRTGISLRVSGVHEGHIVLALKKLLSPKNAMFQRYLGVRFEELE